MQRAVIFDMDGVIFDSERATFELWCEVAKENNIPDIEATYVKLIGVNESSAEKIMTETYGDDFPYSEYKKIIKQRFANRFGGKNLPVKPYVTELLEYLSCGGYKIAVASSTKTDEIKRRLSETGLRKYFDVVLGGDTVSKSKPNPDIFLKAIKELQIERENAFVIEDSHNGIRAAYKAGIKGIMVPDLLMPDDEIKQKAFKIFDNLCEVKAYFESLEI